jgi:hypothetical protein
MRCKKLILIVLSIFLVSALFISITFLPAPVSAQEKKERIKGEELGTYLVRIIEHGGLFPKEARIKPGTTVIWVNTTSGYPEILFTGEQVEVACKSPVHFIAHPTEGGFYSDRTKCRAVAPYRFRRGLDWLFLRLIFNP